MKFILVLFATLPLTLSAQKQIGIYFGYADSHQKYEDWVEIPDGADISISGLNFGLMISQPIASKFELESRLGYSRKGAACEPGFIGVGPIPDPFVGDTDLLIDYVEMPMKVNYHIPFGKEKFSFKLGAGYGASYAFKASRIVHFLNSDVEESPQTIGQSGRVNRIDHGIYSSCRLSYIFGDYQMFFSAEYYSSFRNADKFNSSKNRTSSLNVGISKAFSKKTPKGGVRWL